MSEQSINIADAKKHLSELLGRVAYGKERIIITKRGKPMARLVPVEGEEKEVKPLPSLKDFRASIRISGEPLSTTVVRMRDQERY